MKRKGIFECQTRWQNGHYQSVKKGEIPLNDYVLRWKWVYPSSGFIENFGGLTLATSYNDYLTFEIDSNTFLYRTRSARDFDTDLIFTGNFINDPFQRLEPSYYTTPITQNYTPIFRNIPTYTPLPSGEIVNIGCYVVFFSLRNSNRVVLTKNKTDLTEFDLTSSDDWRPVANVPYYIESNFDPLETKKRNLITSVGLKDIVSYLGVYYLNKAYQQHIFGGLFNHSNLYTVSQGQNSLHSPIYYAGDLPWTDTRYGNNAVARFTTFQQSPLMLETPFVPATNNVYIMAEHSRFIIKRQTDAQVLADWLYRPIIMRVAPTNTTLQQLRYCLLEYVLFSPSSKKIIGEVVTDNTQE